MMEVEYLIECIKRAAVKIEVMRHIDFEGASPEWIEFVDPVKLVEELRKMMARPDGEGE
jgi:hypothetical protein